MAPQTMRTRRSSFALIVNLNGPVLAKVFRMGTTAEVAAPRLVAVGTGPVEAGGYYYEGVLRPHRSSLPTPRSPAGCGRSWSRSPPSAAPPRDAASDSII